MDKLIKLFGLLLVFIIFFMGIAVFFLSRNINEVKNIEINDIDISSLEDGEYIGEFDIGRWANQSRVIIKDGKIINIEITKDLAYAKENVREELITDIIEKQSIKVDGVSGATVTTKAYLKSIENGLLSK